MPTIIDCVITLFAAGKVYRMLKFPQNCGTRIWITYHCTFMLIQFMQKKNSIGQRNFWRNVSGK